MKKTLSILIACVALACETRAQDPNFSQFFASPLTLNPALAGKFNGDYRLAGNFRDQWPTINHAFVTKTASLDFGIMRNRLPEIDKFGIGIMAFTDRAGDGVLVNNYASLTLAYHKGLDENGYHQIGAGFQGTYMNKRLDVTKVTFADMLTPYGFTGITSESFSSPQVKLNYFDLNAGVIYTGTTNGYNNFYIGASMYHINRPKETFQQGNFLLNARTTIQAGGKIPVGPYNYIHFSANHSSQAKAHNTIIGGAYALNLNGDEEEPTNLYLGAWYRVEDAIIPYIGLEFGDFHFGVSYDVNTSALKPGSNLRGGGEFSIIYIKRPVDPNAKKLNCPKF
ncbi:MAG TPA: PorP/SprF family type IX secretion system membrane protein [Chitinophagaceae bacterium]|nr:PorP/SprF family type IX secretion system membrane protein [Chitinophagaceae bacterium]